MISQSIYGLERLITEFTNKRPVRVGMNITEVDLQTFLALINSPANSTCELGHNI